MLYLIHYGELALKGHNRAGFEKRLQENLRRALHRAVAAPGTAEDAAGAIRVQRLPGRIIAEVPDRAAAEVERRIGETFGVATFAPCRSVPAPIEELEAAVLAIVAARREEAASVGGQEPASFAIRARRGEKSYPLTSPELNVRLGAAVQRATGWRVDLTRPEIEVGVEILRERALVHFGTRPGPGGLPVGMSGRVLVLLSGGIDSPVAAWLMLKRGCQAGFVHFHSGPLTDQASQEKVVQLVELLARFQGRARLWLVPFLETQREIVAQAPAALRILLYRRFMVRIAAALAEREQALALVTGEALGQVASQTLANLAGIEAASPLPILRPLIGSDKQEIVNLAQRLGSFAISIQPHQDCCSFLLPERVETWARPEALAAGEARLDVPGLVARALAAAEVREVDEAGGTNFHHRDTENTEK